MIWNTKMAKVLVAILTNGKPEKLVRCLQSVNSNSSPHERIVVINTQDGDYLSQATQLSFDHGFPVKVTESNGTPGFGKNSVLKTFLETDADYLLQIDGDDYISDNCVARLHEEIENNEFDIACLTNGYALTSGGNQIPISQIESLPKILRLGSRWDKEELDFYYRYKEFIRSQTLNGEPFNRYLLISREAAKVKFNESLDIAEDLLHFLQVKRFMKVHEVSSDKDDFLYMYDFSEDGQVMNSIKDKSMLKNIRAMMLEYNTMKMEQPQQQNLPTEEELKEIKKQQQDPRHNQE